MFETKSLRFYWIQLFYKWKIWKDLMEYKVQNGSPKMRFFYNIIIIIQTDTTQQLANQLEITFQHFLVHINT